MHFVPGTGYPDIEIMFIPSNATNDLSQRAFMLTDETFQDVWGSVNRAQTYLLYIVALHSESTGTVRLRSNNPFQYPIIDNAFLTDPASKDIDTLYEGVQLFLRLADTQALQAIGSALQGGPLRACNQYPYLSKDYWYCAIRQMSMDLYHPVGTCPMGPDPRQGHVVDTECRVHGIKGLRIADGSVFPFTLAGHPVAGIVLVGEMVAEFIKIDYLRQ